MMNCVCVQDDNGEVTGGLCSAHMKAARLMFPPTEATNKMAQVALGALGHCTHCVSTAEIDLYKRIYNQMVVAHFSVEE